MWFILFLLVSTNVFGDIGSVVETKGTSCQIERNKQKLSGDKGSVVESMDTYITGNCVSNITFKDDTKVKITENSRLVIDDFVFDSKKSDAGKLAFKIAMGTVRYASGQIAKANPQQVGIQTPTATIAVRGTDFSMTVDETGQSLIMLVPSCKDEKDVKQYELQENICKVGKIEVENLSGKVSLDQAFQATYVQSATTSPSPPTIVNIVESKISNNLIVSKPAEIQNAVKEARKTNQEKELENLETEAGRRLANQTNKNAETTEESRLLLMVELAKKLGCNPSTSVCVLWERNDAINTQSKGTGIAFRNTESEHYTEIKTEGYRSNTLVNISHDDAPATTLIGDGSPGGTVINIKQNSGVLRK